MKPVMDTVCQQSSHTHHSPIITSHMIELTLAGGEGVARVLVDRATIPAAEGEPRRDGGIAVGAVGVAVVGGGIEGLAGEARLGEVVQSRAEGICSDKDACESVDSPPTRRESQERESQEFLTLES